MDQRSWNAQEQPEHSGFAVEMLRGLVGQILQLETALQDGTPATHPGSPLDGDNAAIAPYKVSNLAWTPLVVAIDHLSFFASILQRGDSLNALAPYTLLRPAIEAAASTIWMLEPSRSDERALRALQFMWLDEKDSSRVSRARGAEAPDRDKLRSHLREVAGRRPALDSSRLFAAVTTSEILAIANPKVDGGRHDGVLWWTMLSGLSHGRPHGILALVQREEQSATPDEARTLEIKASLVALAHGLEVAVRYVDTALGLFARRNSAPGELPPDHAGGH